jgi:hypothetical protein
MVFVLAMVLVVAACKDKATKGSVSADCPTCSKVEGAVVVTDGKAQGVVLQAGDELLLLPMTKLPAGAQLCKGEICTDVAELPLTDKSLLPLAGCPCRLLQCRPLCRPAVPLKPPLREAGVIISDKDGKYAVTVDDGVRPPLTLPVTGQQGVLGDQPVSLPELLERSGASPYRPCPCTRIECRPFCKVLGDAVNPTP